MARFFIDRPVFAWVIAIVIMLAGLLSVLTLPVAQYPNIAPTMIEVTALYPGASAKTIEDTVTQVIEQNMKGIDNLLYMTSTSDSTGAASIKLTFEAGTDPDIAQVQVQNKLQLATPKLPQEVQRQGLTVVKGSMGFLLVVAFFSTDGTMDQTDISDYVSANVIDPISRLPGVGEVKLFGAPYAMRIWLDPDSLHAFKLTPSDVVQAINEQNAQIAVGQLGGGPAKLEQQFTVTISGQTRLEKPEEFENILLRVLPDGSSLRIGDVARVELGSERYNVAVRYNGLQATGIAITLSSGANALETSVAVQTKLEELSQYFPAGLKTYFPYDTTPTIRMAVYEVVKTLIEAVALVFLVMYLFLQSFRATLIPTIAVPVVLLGTFGVLSAFGYSINTLTMFAMVLAIGLLVDDAIVVVENVERLMAEEGLSPKEATKKSMDQISGALVGIGMVLSAVFIPMAFLGGSTGVIYRQFSITIVSAMVLSVLIALILTPALCATMLKPAKHGQLHTQYGFFGWFNRKFDAFQLRYANIVTRFVHNRGKSLAVFAMLVGLMALLFVRMPTAYLPDEDQGIIFAMAILPAGSTLEQTKAVLSKMDQHFRETEKEAVDSVMAVAGFSFSGSGENMGIAFVRMRDWGERKKDHLHVQAVAGRAMALFSTWREAFAFAFIPPAVMELGNATGFVFELQDRAGLGHEALLAARNQLLGMAAQNPLLVGVRPNGQEDTPQFRIHIDQLKAAAYGLSLEGVNADIGAAWGGAYVNDFLDKGRVKKVYVQADAPFRMMPADLARWHFRNQLGEMVPFSAIGEGYWSFGPSRLERYNGLPSFEILGQPAPGKSSGDAMLAMEEMAAKLPEGIGFEWTGLSYQERMTGNQAPMVFALSILVVFLCLAALYESWSVPFSVMLVVPLGVIGALLAASMRGMANDVYFQVGLLATMGLAAKNAILIVEFAKSMHDDQGMSYVDAAIQAAKLRLRPILMTSLAFGLGVLPLAISTGAGSGGQNAVGTGVFGGTFSATTLGIFFVPVFYVAISHLFARGNKKKKTVEKTT